MLVPHLEDVDAPAEGRLGEVEQLGQAPREVHAHVQARVGESAATPISRLVPHDAAAHWLDRLDRLGRRNRLDRLDRLGRRNRLDRLGSA
ncbi:hypothetical protein GCM10009590_32650 [Brachybacterium alimentarium]